MNFFVYKFSPFNNKCWHFRKSYIDIIFRYCRLNVFCFLFT